jgi:hypothetical protein
MLFRQQAYYIENENLFFVDRQNRFSSKEAAFKDLESFTCRTQNRIPDRRYKCIVTEIKHIEEESTILDELINRL